MKTNKLLGSALGLAAIFMVGCQDTNEIAQSPISIDESVIVRAGAQNGDVIPGEYIVVLRGNTSATERLADGASYEVRAEAVKNIAFNTLRENGIKPVIEHAYGTALKGFTAHLSESEVEKLKGDPRVDYIEPNRIVMLAPPAGKGPGGGGGGSTAQETPWGITRVGGGATYTGSNVAWIVDSGIDVDHEDLNVDASRGFSAFTKGKDAGVDDGNGHGTHCAGTVAAIDNGLGVIGVAAGATVIPIKVLGARGSGSYDGVIAGIDFVAANGNSGDVANLSLGGPVSQAVDDAVAAAATTGIRFVLAAGNESQDANNSSPARVNGANIYTISASDVNDNFASFSNFGNPPVDYCEPGVNVLSTYPGGYTSLSGTSMAAPHAAGLLLLGNIGNGGTVNGDPDGNADTIGIN